jgi:acyl dehydratase
MARGVRRLTVALYYEDLEVGTELRTAGRTITQADLIAFAMHSGDWNPIHVDHRVAADSAFGQPVAHGMCGMTIMGGLIFSSGWFVSTTVALLGFSDWRFVAPIFVGDTLTCVLRVDGLRLTSSGKYGFVERRLSLWNQNDQCVQEGQSQILIKRKS